MRVVALGAFTVPLRVHPAFKPSVHFFKAGHLGAGFVHRSNNFGVLSDMCIFH
jgi:hypothetical protein